MEFLKNKGWRGAGVLAVALLLTSGIAFGQAQTGNLYAKVSDEQAAPLPGVSATLTGIGAPVTQVTNLNGEVRFVHLSPATYTLEFSLQGFAKLTRKGIIVAVNDNTQVNVTMKLAGVQESVVVTGESPLLDKRSTGANEQIGKVELEGIPTARDPWVILQSAPGVQIDRVNVGGSESGQQSVYVGKGTDGFQGTWNVDGVNITDMGALGSSPAYYDFDSFAEMNVVTGGADASIQTPGTQLNMVTKRGTNDVHGSARVIGTSNKLQSNNISPELEAQLIRTNQAAIGNQIKSIQDYGAEVGGPVVKDKLWLWGSYGRSQINNIVASGYPDNTVLEDFGGKLNAQLLPENTFTAVYSYADKNKIGRNASPTRPPETAFTQTGPTKLYKLEDSHIFSSDVFATVAYSRVIGGFGFTTPGQTQAYQDENAIWHNSYYQYSTFRPQTQVTATPSVFLRTGSVGHEIKMGFNYRSTPVDSSTSWPQGIIGYAPGQGFTDQGNAVFVRPAVRAVAQNYYNGFLSDTMTINKLTATVGVRYDYQQSNNLPAVVPDPAYGPANWPEVGMTGFTVTGTGSLIWRNLSPRLGLTYAIGDQGKTLVKASFAHFVNQLGGGVPTYDSNAPYGTSNLYYNWNDANGNHIVDHGEVDFAGGVVGSYYVDPSNPNKSSAINMTNYNMKTPSVNEFLLGFEHEVMPAFVVALGGTYRHLYNFTYTPSIDETTGLILGSSNYTCTAAGPYPIPNGTPQMINVCNLNPGVLTTANIQTQRPGYYQTYWSVDASATKRYSDKWMARLNFQYSDWTQHGLAEGQGNPSNINNSGGGIVGSESDGGIVTASPGAISGAKTQVFINARWQATASGMYTLPLDFNLSTSIYAREGYPVPYYRQVSSIIGRTLDGNINRNSQYTLGLVNDSRLNSVFEWDLGLSKVVTVGPLNITLMADVFNVLNRNTVLQRTTRIYDPAGTATAVDVRDNNIAEQQSPRIWRFGARLSF
ncbi:MAG TPA: carboxypeptidase regulatory-like domain-containing protein [Thermoanaerobaculia bacterium]|nr:carboxypeptidase regulatory-like domain-containing protein [Thermoanaerobaculia bacterium]